MSEINEDIKISMAEVESSLGINLTAENTKIKHTGTGVVEFSSNGAILLKSGDNNDEYDEENLFYSNSIILEGGSSNNGQAGNILLFAGNSLENGFGGSILLAGGNSSFLGEFFPTLRSHNSSLDQSNNLLNNNLINTKIAEKKSEILNKVGKNQNINSYSELNNHSEGTTSNGGAILIVAGDREEDFTILGDIIIGAGQGYNTASGGTIYLASGNNQDEGQGGDFVILAGSGGDNGITGSADGGELVLIAGDAGNNSLGGDVIISGGDNGTHLNSRGGRIVMDSLMRLPIFETKPDRDSIEQAEGITGDIAFITGSQVLCLHDGEQWSNLPIPNTDTYFKYFKWEITKVLNISNDSVIQASEFRFTNNGIDVDMSGVTCTSNTIENVLHPLSDLIDNDLDTFWYADILASGATGLPVSIVFEFPSAVQTDGYKWATGPDVPSRDPVSWKVYGSNNNSLWVQLDELTDYSSLLSPTDRKTYTVLRYDIDNKKELVSYNDDLALKALNGNDVNISSEPAITGPPGRINMLNVMRSVVFDDIAERNAAINPPLEGDICFVRDLGDEVNFQKLMVYTTYGWQVCN